MINRTDSLALALAELKTPSNPWVARALRKYPLKRGARKKPLSVIVPGRHRYYFPTVDPDVYMRVVVSKNSTEIEVNARLSPAIHAELLVTSDTMTQQQLSDRLGRPSDNRFSCGCEDDASCEVPAQGMWNLTSKLSYPGEAEEHFEDVLRQLEPGDRALTLLVRKNQARAYMCLVMKEIPGSDLWWVISPKTLTRLGEIGINLNFQRAPASIAHVAN